jgi:hypothetical protein
MMAGCGTGFRIVVNSGQAMVISDKGLVLEERESWLCTAVVFCNHIVLLFASIFTEPVLWGF